MSWTEWSTLGNPDENERDFYRVLTEFGEDPNENALRLAEDALIYAVEKRVLGVFGSSLSTY
jgi:hypothetical protein